MTKHMVAILACTANQYTKVFCPIGTLGKGCNLRYPCSRVPVDIHLVKFIKYKDASTMNILEPSKSQNTKVKGVIMEP